MNPASGFGMIALAACSAWASAADAADDRPRNALVAELARCMDIREDLARLACTDVAARALVDAERARDITVVDRESARRTRRSLFGITLGGGDPVTGSREEPADRVEQLDTTVANVRAEVNDRWLLTLAEGGRWRTTELWSGGAIPRVGATVLVRRALLGSYTLRTPGARIVRVQRVP